MDAAETERLPHAFDVGDELILGALLDRHPLRAAVAAVIVEHESHAEGLGQRRQAPAQPRGVGARAAV